MPAPMSAFAAICESIAGIDPGDVRAIDNFFLIEFATLDHSVREAALSWLLSLDQEPTDDDLCALEAMLSALGFRPCRRSLQRENGAVASGDDRKCA